MNKEYFITSGLAHKILFSIIEKQKIPYRISLDIRTTYSSLSKAVKKLAEGGLIEEVWISKKTRLINLTKKGKEFIGYIKKAYEVLEK